MSKWSKLVRYVGKDGKIRLGQPVDLAQDVGAAVASGQPFKVNVINGDAFTGTVSSEEDTAEKLLSPIGREDCSLIRCLGLNYFGHANESNFPIPKEPILFIKPRTALAGPGEIAVAKAAQDDQLDYETELALVIGKDALDVSEDEAMDYVLGFTCANDVSVRKLQLANQQWCFGKGFDQSCPIGPALVRTGHLDPDRLNFKGVLSGETVQEDNTSDMIFKCAKTVAFLSQGTTLEKGTIILMGTPSGIGWFRSPKRIIKHGETMTITFEGIGSLVNTFNYI